MVIISLFLSPERNLRVQTSKLSCDPNNEIFLKVIPSIIISLTSNLSLFSKIPKTDRCVLKTHFVHTCAPLWHPVRSETKTKGDLYAQVQPKRSTVWYLLGLKKFQATILVPLGFFEFSDKHTPFSSKDMVVPLGINYYFRTDPFSTPTGVTTSDLDLLREAMRRKAKTTRRSKAITTKYSANRT